jgi:hypothetical protein
MAQDPAIISPGHVSHILHLRLHYLVRIIPIVLVADTHGHRGAAAQVNEVAVADAEVAEVGLRLRRLVG